MMNRPLRSIVAGIGRADEPDPHLSPALRIAEANGAALYLVHAYRLPDPLLSPYPEMAVFSPEVLRSTQQAVQSRLESQVAKAGGSARVEVRTVPVPADAALIDVAEEVGADLIMVGATERGTLSRTVLGTTAGRVLRTASVPVLVNRRPDSGLLRRVLMTTDLSDLSARAYQRGLAMVESLGAGDTVDVRTLLVVGDTLTTPPPARQQVLREIAESNLRPFLERASPGSPGTAGKVRLGDPATETLSEAGEWGADLVVLGTHGRGGLSRFLIGSVAESVVRQALCDVLVIPAAAVTGADAAPPPKELI
jgi:nucleotide-binding universal stress UspA family protein